MPKQSPPTKRQAKAVPTDSSPDVAVGLRELAALDRAALVARWTVAFGCPAPRHVQAPLLRLALGWHLQMVASGRGQAARKVNAIPVAKPTRPRVRPLVPGTRLLREWQGKTHHVTVTTKGFEYAGAKYGSLTAIAKKITGTGWSGPLFFGLRP